MLVGRTGLPEADAPGAAAQVASVLDLPTALPSLWTRHGTEPPLDLLRGGRLRTEEEVEADEAQPRQAATSGAETAEQIRNALSSKSGGGGGGAGRRSRRGSADEGSNSREAKSPVLAPA